LSRGTPELSLSLRRCGWLLRWWLVLALVWAPALGLMHRHLHASGPGNPVQVTATAEAAGLGRLFAHQGGASDCPLFDQLCAADGLVSLPALALPVALPVFTFQVTLGDAPVRRVARYDARGPPAVH